MKKIGSRTLVIILVVILIFAAIALVRYRKAQLATQPLLPYLPVPVYVKSGQWARLAVTQHYLGIIGPEVEAMLSAQTTGYITKLYKDVGDRLRKGRGIK